MTVIFTFPDKCQNWSSVVTWSEVGDKNPIVTRVVFARDARVGNGGVAKSLTFFRV